MGTSVHDFGAIFSGLGVDVRNLYDHSPRDTGGRQFVCHCGNRFTVLNRDVRELRLLIECPCGQVYSAGRRADGVYLEKVE